MNGTERFDVHEATFKLLLERFKTRAPDLNDVFHATFEETVKYCAKLAESSKGYPTEESKAILRLLD